VTKTLSLSRFTREAKLAIASAQRLADKLQHEEAGSLHLFYQLLERESEVVDALTSIRVDVSSLKQDALAALNKLPSDSEGKSRLSRDMLHLLRRAEQEAGKRDEIGVADVVNALTRESNGPSQPILAAHDIAPGALRQPLAGQGEGPVSHDGEGAALLRDFASEVRTEMKGLEEQQIRERGRKLLDRLEKQLTGKDGVPGLGVVRDDAVRATKLILTRLPVDAEIEVIWEHDSSAVALSTRKGEFTNVIRFVYNRHEKEWGQVDGPGSFYVELRAAIRKYLYPEMKG